jgi:hypothetical protein
MKEDRATEEACSETIITITTKMMSKKIKKTTSTLLLSIDQILDSKMVLFIKANGKEVRDTARVYKFGQTALAMKDSGNGIRLTEKENSGMLTEMFLMVSGKTIKLMDTGFTRT